MLVVLALIAIFVSLAVPSFQGTLKRYRVSAASAEIANALQYARAEAIRSRQAVTVSQTNTPGDCTPAAGTARGADWSCGINVYVDTSGDGVQQANEPTLKTISATDFKGLSISLVLMTNAVGGNANIVYSPLGFAQGGNVGDAIYIWPAGSDTAATSPYTYTICLGAGGQVRAMSSYAASMTTPNTCP